MWCLILNAISPLLPSLWGFSFARGHGYFLKVTPAPHSRCSSAAQMPFQCHSFRTNTPKRCPFHYRRLECKSRKPRNTWSNRLIWPWSTEWSRQKANRILPREHTGHTEIRLIIFFAAKVGKALYSQQKQDQELTVAQIINCLLPNSDINWRK